LEVVQEDSDKEFASVFGVNVHSGSVTGLGAKIDALTDAAAGI
jgi:hypothetical protein